MVCTSFPYRLCALHGRLEHPGQFSASRTAFSWSIFNERQHATRIAREIRLLEQALKATDARTVVDNYEQDDTVLGELA
jgi:hypothetical protein